MRFILLIGLLSVYLLASTRPDSQLGAYDAVAMWNLRARMTYYYGFEAASRFEWLHHPEYPPLIPLSIAFGYSIFGDTPAVNIVIHGAIFAALFLLFRRWWELLLVGITSLLYATFQYADLAVALAFLIAVIFYAKRRDLLAGIALGVLVLVKNEGLVIALIFLSVWTVADRRPPIRALLGLLPGMALLIAWRLWISQPTDVLAEEGALERALDLSRQLVILPAMIKGLFSFVYGAILLTIIWALVTHAKIRLFVPLVSIGLIFVSHWLVYTISYWEPVTQHINTSWDRLILQVFPVFVYILAGNERISLEAVEGNQRSSEPSGGQDAIINIAG